MALTASFALPAMAQEQMQGRDASSRHFSIAKMSDKCPGASLCGNNSSLLKMRVSAPTNTDDYVPAGIKVLRQTEFSTDIFQNGKEGKPDLYTKLNNPNIDELPEQYPYPAWFNLLPECFEDGDIWGGNNLYPAGGMGCLFNKSSYEVYEANLVVPLMDASAPEYEGIVTIRFKAKAEKEGAYILIEAAETNGMAPSWTTMGSAMSEVQPEWLNYEVSFYGGNASVIANIYNPSGVSIYIDDLIVYQEGQPCQTPVLLPPTNYMGETWTANWKPALGADGYLLTVYSVDTTYDEYGHPTNKEYSYLCQDLIIDGGETSSYDITGAISGQKYFYTVKSYKGIKGQEGYYESVAQNDPMVVNILMPTTMHPVTDFSPSKYTASWDAIPGAEVYNYWVRYEHKAQSDGEFVVTDDNFDGVVDGDGFATGWTKENPDQYSYSTVYFTNRLGADGKYHKVAQAGWKGLNCAPYTDYIAIDAWQYLVAGSDAGYLSPELDLSKDNGRFTISMDCAGCLYQYIDEETGDYISGYPRVAVAVFNYNDEINNWQQVALQYYQNVKFDWKKASFTFDCGSERTIVGIYAVYAPEWLFIDNLKLVQNYKKDDVLLDPCIFERYVPETSLEVTPPTHFWDCKLYHQVCGVKSEIVEDSPMGDIAFLESPMTPLQMVEGSDDWIAGIESVPSFNNATVQIIGDNTLQVLNPEGLPVDVYDIYGRSVYSDNSGKKALTVGLANGMYIVKVGTRSVKLTF